MMYTLLEFAKAFFLQNLETEKKANWCTGHMQWQMSLTTWTVSHTENILASQKLVFANEVLMFTFYRLLPVCLMTINLQILEPGSASQGCNMQLLLVADYTSYLKYRYIDAFHRGPCEV